ncbi:MAG: hypothetical protein LC803_10865 [Acidobacteria bacterium]|nr:hypothetical protein [Acidobacteriota bacterium]
MQTWLPITLSGLLLVVVTIHGFLFQKQWAAMDRQAELIAKQLEIMNMSELPYIRVSGIGAINTETGKKPTVEVKFENAGRTPAVHAIFETKISVRDTPLPENPDFPTDTSGASQDFLPAGAPTSQLLTKKQELTVEQVEGINNGRLTFYVYGRVRYEDMLGRPRWLKFCSYYVPGLPTLTTCSQHNSSG